MNQYQRNLVLLMIGSFLTAMSFSIVVPFLPQFLRELGVTRNLEQWSGATFAVSFVASSIMAPIWGSLADRYGRKPMIIRSGLSIALAYYLMTLIETPGQLIVLRLANGALAGFIPGSIALIATSSPDQDMGRNLGLLQTGIASGNILGPIAGGAMAHAFGLRPAMNVAAAVIFAATLLVLFGVRESFTPVSGQRPSPLADLRTAFDNRPLRRLLLTAMIAQSSVFGVQPLVTLFVEKLTGTSENASLVAGVIFSLVGVATIIMAPIWGTYGGKMGYDRVLVVGLLGAGLLFIPQAFVQNPLQFGILRFAFGVFIAALAPSLNSMIARSVPSDFRGRAFGISTAANQMGAVVGPLVGGLVAGQFGMASVFVLMGLGLVATSQWNRTRSSVATSAD